GPGSRTEPGVERRLSCLRAFVEGPGSPCYLNRDGIRLSLQLWFVSVIWSGSVSRTALILMCPVQCSREILFVTLNQCSRGERMCRDMREICRFVCYSWNEVE